MIDDEAPPEDDEHALAEWMDKRQTAMQRLADAILTDMHHGVPEVLAFDLTIRLADPMHQIVVAARHSRACEEPTEIAHRFLVYAAVELAANLQRHPEFRDEIMGWIEAQLRRTPADG